MDIRPIRTDADYQAALREVAPYFETEPETGSPDGDRFDVMLTLIEAYEAKCFPIDLPDPVEALKFWRGACRGQKPRTGMALCASPKHGRDG